LTPTRYLWSGYELYFRNPLLRAVSYPFVQALRKWDKIAAKRADMTIAISSEVKERISKYYGKKSQVIFPPGGFIRPTKETRKGNFYLVVNRLVPYKKVDLVIKAFNRLKLPLRIIGVGSESIKLKLMAKENIKFLNEVDDTELINNYQRAKAVIFPQEEDFGIVPVEAQSLGTPVIAFKKGGALDTVIDGKTGILFDKQTVESLIDAVKRFNEMKFSKEDLIINASKFSKGVFKDKLLSIIKTTI
jgi:glycosyltransferase involved in cell wall biosynthesis